MTGLVNHSGPHWALGIKGLTHRLQEKRLNLQNIGRKVVGWVLIIISLSYVFKMISPKLSGWLWVLQA